MATGLSSITLQSEKSSIITGDVIGRLNFLAGSETDTGDAISQAASVYAQAENALTSTTNQTALVFATANDDPATAKLKISGSGHFLPINTRSYNIGSSTTQFANSYTASGNYDSLILANLTPASTTNALYNTGGTLYFNGSAVGGGGLTGTQSGVAFFATNSTLTTDSAFVWNSGSDILSVSGTINTNNLNINSRYTEGYDNVSIASNALSINLASGNLFTCSLNSNINNITITNAPSGVATGFTIIFTADGTARTITWPTGVKWPGGTAPTPTSSANKIDVYSFLTTNSGVNWLGFIGGQNF